MALIRIHREDQDERRTLGRIYVGSRMVGYTLEPPWKGNKRNISCIPPGQFWWKRCLHNGRLAFKIADVPGRDGILIHAGNDPGDTEGCILPGLELGADNNSVRDSRKAMDVLDGILLDEGSLMIFNPECFIEI